MTVDDTRMMEEALALAQRAAGRTSPNPLVGAVLVADGQVVGRGFHARAGEAHAEVVALREAGSRARGATLYVTLEPCCHAGRTGPCTEALINAGVRRVVAAMADPDPQVNGRGLARLREAGVDVAVGVLEARARRVNEFYVKHRRTGLPFVALKWAMSLDGKTAARRGSATAITGEAARRYAHELRNRYDAALVGVQTVLADDPQLTCRLPADAEPAPRNPLRIVVDSRLRTPPGARVVTGVADAPTLIATTAVAPADRVEALRRAGVEVLVQDHVGGPVDLRALMQTLGRRGLLSVLIEGGGTVNASALASGVVDKVIALIAPRLIGGAQAPTPVDGPGLNGVNGAVRLRDVQVQPLGGDLAVEGYLATAEEG
ncbi:MAG: bifunctional diaminohydroxyphosphoribosylaminopyrimidine deaminase/5-amino-6-(5-phosphoribosylamino)uracil reductase RibD [Armatimonadota bacterium]|nr:bifunctional diaminohydroxyphosphoribosylaminopyrimidine deaminase/5-amino-6-(5-phosphoribosylamino)uracil reductase RibD [Armatimonadota bacterium]MDR7549525.1 bifunctional diaminohydroxyphosphoribosylaminopyrimidine deaminase/5-amino-6-(5-phosphoribosylamino)uracil reductase RibD [Armatimonadota bacterium]